MSIRRCAGAFKQVIDLNIKNDLSMLAYRATWMRSPKTCVKKYGNVKIYDSMTTLKTYLY